MEEGSGSTILCNLAIDTYFFWPDTNITRFSTIPLKAKLSQNLLAHQPVSTQIPGQHFVFSKIAAKRKEER